MADLPRPVEVPPEIDDATLREVVIQFMSGARVNVLASLLKMEPAEFRRMMVTDKWQALLISERDAVVGSRLGSVHNIEQQLLNAIDAMLENGVEGITPLGEHYTRKLNPKELAALANTMQSYQVRIDKIAKTKPSRVLFSRDARLAELERFADSVPIEGTVTKAVN